MIRRAAPHEAAALTALALRSKAYWGYDEGFMADCATELTVSARQILEHPVYLVDHHDGILGFYGLDALSDVEAELAYLFVEPAFIGKGYGARLLTRARSVARDLGYRALVIQGDPHARPFYAAMGATQVGERPSGSIPGRVRPLFRIDLA